MLRNQREKDLPTKQEGGEHHKPPAPITSSRLWSGLKNPRIVRVSRAFGGKDRHSKVSTIRGLRDRRVRLSVPTAIQLYDLQDKLGLNQPSKVVDWLLNAAQNEIDKLPPLQFPPEYFQQFSNRSALPVSLSAEEPPVLQMISSSSNKASNGSERLTSAFPQYSAHWNSDALQRFKRREAMEKDNNNVNEGDNNAQISPSEEPLYRSSMPYATSYYQWEASNTYLSQLGIIRPSPTQSDAPPLMSFLSSGSLIPQESQIMFCPPRVMPSMFSSYVATPNTGSDVYDARLQNPRPNSQRDD